MYVQGVSTRKASAILEELCGSSVSSTHVSHCAAKLDENLALWRSRPLGSFSYVILDARYEKVRQAGRVLDCTVLIAVELSIVRGVRSSRANSHATYFIVPRNHSANFGMPSTIFVCGL